MDRMGQQPGPLAQRRRVGHPPVEAEVTSCCLDDLCRRQRGWHRGRGGHHLAARPEDLSEGLLLTDLEPTGAHIDISNVVSLSSESGVDAPLQLAVEKKVENDTGQNQDYTPPAVNRRARRPLSETGA